MTGLMSPMSCRRPIHVCIGTQLLVNISVLYVIMQGMWNVPIKMRTSDWKCKDHFPDEDDEDSVDANEEDKIRIQLVSCLQCRHLYLGQMGKKRCSFREDNHHNVRMIFVSIHCLRWEFCRFEVDVSLSI